MEENKKEKDRFSNVEIKKKKKNKNKTHAKSTVECARPKRFISYRNLLLTFCVAYFGEQYGNQ